MYARYSNDAVPRLITWIQCLEEVKNISYLDVVPGRSIALGCGAWIQCTRGRRCWQLYKYIDKCYSCFMNEGRFVKNDLVGYRINLMNVINTLCIVHSVQRTVYSVQCTVYCV